MRNFINNMKQGFKVKGKDALTYALFTVGGGIVGIIITLIILFVDGKGNDYGQIGAVLALTIGAVFLFFAGIFSVSTEFNLAVSMGKARKYYVLSRYFLWMINVVTVLGITILISVIEEGIYGIFFPNAICEVNVRAGLLNPLVLTGSIICFPAALLLSGAIILKFSNKALWIFWGISMIFNLSVSKISHALTAEEDSLVKSIFTGIFNFFRDTPALGLLLLFVAATSILLAVAHAMIRKQRVTI